MRITFLLSGYEEYGLRRVTLDLLSEWRAAGHDVRAICFGVGRLTKELQEEHRIRVEALGTKNAPPWRDSLLGRTKHRAGLVMYRRSLRRALRSTLARDDSELFVIHQHGNVGLASFRKPGTRCVWLMATPVFGSTTRIRILRKQLASSKVLPIANSHFTAQSLSSPDSAVAVAHLGVDPTAWPAEAGAPVTRRDLGWPDDAIVLAIVARLVPEKGQARLLDAVFGDGGGHYGNFHLLFIGDDEGSGESDRLSALVHSYGAGSRVRLVGRVDRGLRNWYDTVDVAVNCYLGTEAFGLSIVEAMLSGTPVLAHAAGGPSEIVVDGTTGWLLQDVSVQGIREGLRRILIDQHRWSEMGGAGRERALAEFTSPIFSERVLSAARDAPPY